MNTLPKAYACAVICLLSFGLVGAKSPPKPIKQSAPHTTETVVRYRAKVLTQYGGKVLVRNAPSKRGKKLGFLYDQEEVYVVGETSNCEVINKIEGCWVKVVDVNGLTGYSFGGYLNYNE